MGLHVQAHLYKHIQQHSQASLVQNYVAFLSRVSLNGVYRRNMSSE